MTDLNEPSVPQQTLPELDNDEIRRKVIMTFYEANYSAEQVVQALSELLTIAVVSNEELGVTVSMSNGEYTSKVTVDIVNNEVEAENV